MPYSETDFDRMDTDPVLQRQYFWTRGQKAILRSIKAREQGNLAEAQLQARFGRTLLDNLDRLTTPSST